MNAKTSSEIARIEREIATTLENARREIELIQSHGVLDTPKCGSYHTYAKKRMRRIGELADYLAVLTKERDAIS